MYFIVQESALGKTKTEGWGQMKAFDKAKVNKPGKINETLPADKTLKQINQTQ